MDVEFKHQKCFMMFFTFSGNDIYCSGTTFSVTFPLLTHGWFIGHAEESF